MSKNKTAGRRTPRDDRFYIRHEDADVVVVEKRAGLLTVRTPTGREKDLVGLLDQRLGRGERTVHPVHRLDQTVSGLLVFARTRSAKDPLDVQFREHTVDRRYVAAVAGIIPDDQGTFESWLSSDPRTLRMHSGEEGEGKHAITHWRVVERVVGGDATLLEVELETGARNQIRVHFAEAGFPLLGERKYLEARESKSMQGHQRIFLHAAMLAFTHPTTGERMKFEAALPPDLARWLEGLRAGRIDRTCPIRPKRPLESKHRRSR